MRGGVPVFRRPCGSFSSLSRADRDTAGGSPPARPHSCSGPHGSCRPERCPPSAPRCGRGNCRCHLRHGAHHPVALHHQIVHRLLEQPQVRLVLQHAANRGLVQNAVGLRARGAHRRALCCCFKMRNWMPASSVASAMAPPSASTSFTRWPLPMPPMLGLQLICPSVSMLCVSSSVAQPCAPRQPTGLGAGVATADDDDIKFLGYSMEGGVDSVTGKPAIFPSLPRLPAAMFHVKPSPQSGTVAVPNPPHENYSSSRAAPANNRSTGAWRASPPIWAARPAPRPPCWSCRSWTSPCTTPTWRHAEPPRRDPLKGNSGRAPAWIICSPGIQRQLHRPAEEHHDWASSPWPGHPVWMMDAPFAGKVVGVLSASTAHWAACARKVT